MAMHDRRRRHVARWLIPAFLSALFLGACAVPESMRVRSGVDPRHQDDKVRFRTTYYFRVFDVCHNPRINRTNGPPKLDSLYRFRMTGKSSALFTQVHFESGILHKTEIDPFGSSVVFDDKLGRHRFVSREETDAEARHNVRYREIQRRMDLLKELDKLVDEQRIDQGGDQTAADEARQLIKEVGGDIEKLIADLDTPTGDPPPDPEDGMPIRNSDSNTTGQCPEGTELRRGFQIMGPEGVATFNQNQRLIMAMTSNGKPLIGALKELSGRMLREHGSGSDFLLPLVRENLAALRAERIVDRLESDPEVSVEQLIEQVIDAFNRDASQEVR